MKLLIFCALGLAAATATAIPPPYVSDRQLAHFPIVVIAQWDGSPITDHSRIEGNMMRDLELRTHLKVIRVLKGNVEPGVQPLAITDNFGWDENGSVATYTSTEMLGEVEDVRKPCLWFLQSGKSWDKKDPEEQLTASNYRCIQEEVLEPFYAALASPDPNKNVGPLLSSNSYLVAHRSLDFVNGERDPFADLYASELGVGLSQKDNDTFPPLVQYVQEVRALVDKGSPAVRREATAVYAGMVGSGGRESVRAILANSDPGAVLIAANFLVRWHDAAALPKVADRVRGIKAPLDEQMCAIARWFVASAAKWKDASVVPALIEMLALREKDDGWYSQPPVAAEAGSALQAITGYLFQTDTDPDRLRAAWSAAEARPSSQRLETLVSALGPNRAPFVISGQLEGDCYRITVTNTSGRPVTVNPFADFEYEIRSSQGESGGGMIADSVTVGGTKLLAKTTAIRLDPGQKLSYVFLRAKAKEDYGGIHYLFTKGKDPLEITMTFARSDWVGTLTFRTTGKLD